MDQVAGRGGEGGKGRSHFCHLSHEETEGGLEYQRQSKEEGTGGGSREPRMKRAETRTSEPFLKECDIK